METDLELWNLNLAVRSEPEQVREDTEAGQAPPELPGPTNPPQERKPVAGAGTIRIVDGAIVIAFPYDPVKVAYVKMIARAHSLRKAYDPATKEWKFPIRCALDAAHFTELAWDDEFGATVEKERAKSAKPALREIVVPNMADPLLNGKTLKVHQRQAVEWMLKVRQGILADEMGLGKTLDALVASKAIHEQTGVPTCIITKAAIVGDWQEEARAIGHKSFTVHSWARVPEPAEGYPIVLVCDEAHYLQNWRSQRTQKVVELAKQAVAVFHLTGTPMKNGLPINLFPLLRTINHPLASSKQRFETQFCKAAMRKIKKKTGQTIRFWEAKGAENLDELRKQIGPFMLRRLKKDCIELPEKTRVLRDVEVTPEMQAEYMTTFLNAKERFDNRVATGEVSEDGEAMALLTFIRRAASIAKIEPAIELIEEIIDQGSKVIVFSEFTEGPKRIADHFKVIPFIGETRPDVRRAIIQRFQEGDSPVFAATRESGGTGLTLTAGNYVLLLDRPMTPGDAEQAEDRAHRIGQHWPVTAYWLRAFNVCKTIDRMLERKMKVIDQVIDADNKRATGGGAIKPREVLQSLFRQMSS